MEKEKKLRSALRSSFTKMYNTFKDGDVDATQFNLFRRKYENICKYDDIILSYLAEKAEQNDVDEEFEICDTYHSRFF